MNAPATPRPRIRIRRPTADFPSDEGAPAFVLDRPIAGVRVGIRHDGTWRSWQYIARVWADFLRRDGAIPVLLQTGERTGPEGEKTRADLEAWHGRSTARCRGSAPAARARCGACATRSASRRSRSRRSPRSATSSSRHARTTASFLGHPSLKVLVLPYPLETRPESELQVVAEQYYPRFLAMVGAAK